MIAVRLDVRRTNSSAASTIPFEGEMVVTPRFSVNAHRQIGNDAEYCRGENDRAKFVLAKTADTRIKRGKRSRDAKLCDIGSTSLASRVAIATGAKDAKWRPMSYANPS